MDVITGLVTLAAVLFVVAYIVQPFFSERRAAGASSAGRSAAALLRQQADLLNRRNELYAALRELDFDYQTGKVAEDDYGQQRYGLVAQGVELLQQLDGLPPLVAGPEADPVEAAIRAVRSGQTVPVGVAAVGEVAARGEAAGFCPQCGSRVFEGDRFCGSCGAAL